MKLVIGIDLDGTLAKYEGFVGAEIIGDPDPRMVKLLHILHKRGHVVCIWTTRATYLVKEWLIKHGLQDLIWYVNNSPYPTDDRKCSFDFYIGDNAIRYTGDINSVLTTLSENPHWNKSGAVHNFERDKGFSNRSPLLYFKGVGRQYIDMFETEYQQLWEQKQKKTNAFLTICSHAKPYSKSFIHGMIRHALQRANYLSDVDYIHISNAGLIPQEAETQHPFCAYDWNGDECTPEDTAYHKQVLDRRLRNWCEQHRSHYKRIICYLRKGGNTATVMEPIAKQYNIEFLSVPTLKESTFMALPDPDDCLADSNNLATLFRTLV